MRTSPVENPYTRYLRHESIGGLVIYIGENMITTADITELLKDEDVLLGVNKKQREKFYRWYPKNMHIINKFHQVTHLLKEKGKRDHYSARAIFEHIRWNTLFSDSDEEYKIQDNVCSSIVRVVVHMFPEFQGMFTMKKNKLSNEVTN